MLPKFPQFVSLKIDDKDKYEELISEHTPYSDILFSTLHIWWNLGGNLSVSSISSNLVINYHLPFDKNNSGFGLVGKNEIDDSVDEIIAYCKKHEMPAFLVHVPEFVVDAIENKEKYSIREEEDFSEYILDVESLSTLEGHAAYDVRKKINRFYRDVENREVIIESLDLSNPNNRSLITESLKRWERLHPPKNDKAKTEHLALKVSLENSKELGLFNAVLYIDGELQGFVIYDQPLGKEYFVIHHLRVDYEIPGVSDYLHYELAKIAKQSHVVFLNIEMDLGIESLKKHKNLLRPVKFLKKYRIALKSERA